MEVGERSAELASTNSLLRDEIAEGKRVEIALREATERYRIVSELTSDYAYAFKVEPDGTLLWEWITEAFTHTTGFTLAEVEERGGWVSLIYPEDMPIAQQRVQSLLAGRKDISELRVVTKDEKVRWLRDHGHPVWDEVEGRVIRIYGAAKDITDRKQMEQQIIQSECLAAMERWAAALAHEINNPLQIIRSHLELLMDFPLESEEREYYLRIIRQEIEHLSDVSRFVLDYARSPSVPRQRVAVAELLEEALVLAGKELQQNPIRATAAPGGSDR